ncbi:MAG: hypothetical protein ACREDE_09920 [Thermoplasmata archaeon]
MLDSAQQWPLHEDEIGSCEKAILRDLERGDLVEEVVEDLDLTADDLWGSLERVWEAERLRGLLRRAG